ncbi:hypothetical protein TMatcc_004956 [Talaromyces marneffei ATCC 18224]|nr:uncharacterized protein EYB26_000128 [Talaromyces marneffei]KAE8557501.1 hypothetical protein EYB25_002208 [Talaromyces marneffei]QGA12484.1 hypothetical protein EYB26_000128 [Talaromyces marneffei]
MIPRSAYTVPQSAASRRLSNSWGTLTSRRSMSLMPRFFPPSPFSSNRSRPTGEFSSLFRLLDDYTDHVTRRFDDGPFADLSRNMTSTFAPKFDIKETDEAYQLDGEIPGIEKDAIELAFLDENTLQIKGRTERSFSSDTPSNAAEDGANKTGAGSESADSASINPPAETTTTKGAEPTKAVAQTETSSPATTENSGNGRYWATERSVGEFSRTFYFPAPVDQEAVKASLKNGVLSITVPKKVVEEPTARRINIE